MDHDQIDFVALAAQLTNEQKILATLERIELLLAPVSNQATWLIEERTAAAQTPETPTERVGKINALMAKTGTRRK